MRQNKSIDNKDLEILDEINNLIKKNEGIYKSALVIIAISKDKDSWRNVFTKITLSNKDDKFSEKLDYDDFILNKVSITIDDFINMLGDLVKKGELKVKNCPDVKATGTFDQNAYWRYRSSNDKWVKNEWPTKHYIFKIEGEIRGQTSGLPLVSIQYPHFPNATSAIEYYTDIDFDDLNQQLGNIFLYLPNYKLKINQISMGSEYLDLKLILNGIKQEEVIGKIYYEKEGNAKTEDFSIDENPKRIHLDFIPNLMSVYLLGNDGDVLDFRDVNLNWPSSTSKDVVIDVKEDDILTMIKQGENQQIEFKQVLNGKENEDFVETVVAFANSKGGAILIGVGDKSNIVGFKQDKIEEQIINIVRSRCDPFIESEIKSITIDDKPIIIVRINEGKDKPYTLRDKGPYVRRGSTDRIASRFELDEFYKEKKNHRFNDHFDE